MEFTNASNLIKVQNNQQSNSAMNSKRTMHRSSYSAAGWVLNEKQ